MCRRAFGARPASGNAGSALGRLRRRFGGMSLFGLVSNAPSIARPPVGDRQAADAVKPVESCRPVRLGRPRRAGKAKNPLPEDFPADVAGNQSQTRHGYGYPGYPILCGFLVSATLDSVWIAMVRRSLPRR